MQKPLGLSRRAILATAPLVPLASLKAAQSAFTAPQLRLIEAFVDRLIPTDQNGPGARECGVATYIDRSFAGALNEEKPAFVKSLAAVDALAHTTYNAALADLPPAKQDEVLAALENNDRTFFYRMRQLAFEGMFGDPAYGGNKNYAGWDLLRYPGPRMAVSAEDQRLREPIKKLRTSGASHGH